MTPKPGTLLRPLVVSWLRGPATRDRDQFVLVTATAERYEPLELNREQNVGMALSRVRTPEDALAFIRAYGLLTQPGHWIQGEPFPPEFRESFATFERAADNLRRIIHTTMDVRAATRGDRAARERLRKDFAPPDPEADVRLQTKTGDVFVKAREVYSPDALKQDDRSILIQANDWAAVGLMQGLANAEVSPYVFEPAQLFPDPRRTPGQIRLGLFSETLLGYCYVSVVQALSAEPLLVCEECQRVFIVRDKRQKFCEATCANRARFRKFKNNNAVTQSRRRTPHGKATRARRR